MKFNKSYSLSEIAEMVNARMLGNLDIEIKGVNEIHMVEKGDITFVDHPKYYDKALNSKASVIIINKEVEYPEGKALLVTDDPFKAFVSLALKFRPFEPSSNLVSDSAEIGEGTFIQPGAFVGNNVKIGKNCIIHANASIYDHSVIGDNVIIQANSVIGADAYYFQKRADGYHKMESCGRTVLGNNVEVGALCTIDKGVSGDTIIGDGCKLDNHIQIGHDTVIGKHCLIGSHSAIAGVAIIEDDVILWGKVVVNKDLTIGKGAVLLATSGVDKSLEGGKVYFGSPAIEARKKWRELAALRKLPDIIENLV